MSSPIDWKFKEQSVFVSAELWGRMTDRQKLRLFNHEERCRAHKTYHCGECMERAKAERMGDGE